jgi:hypothetical protein
MTALHRTVKLCRRALPSVAISIALTGAAAAQTTQSNPLEDAPDTQLFRSILGGLGLKRGDEPGIEYRERSPLVVPPQMNLPPPQSRTAADSNPNWPVDQDLRRRREYAAAQRRRSPHYDDIEDGRALRPGEMAPGPRGAKPTVLGETTTPQEGAKVLSPSALGYVGNLFTTMFDKGKPESKPFTGEPDRTALTEPPPGYQTPAPGQPYGLGKQTYQPKAMDPMDQAVGREY